jgi:hypothetical protein
MDLAAKTAVVRVTNLFADCTVLLARCVRGLIETRRRRIAHDEQFYRELRVYCRANNVSPVCEDDWRTAATDRSDRNHTMRNSKGDVS